MSDNQLSLSLSPALQERLKQFQHNNQFSTPDEAVVSILRDFFSIEDAKQASGVASTFASDRTMALPSEQQEALLASASDDSDAQQKLEAKVETLTRQLIQLQQQLTDQYDQLRGQVATIHLSHSGLIKNLRERVETLEPPTEKE